MNALALMVPRQQSRAFEGERREEEDFDGLVESIETLLFTSADRAGALDRAVLGVAMAEVRARWPDAAVGRCSRVEAGGRQGA